jgi:glycosyltransferase involved in cell wall biosynthesis
MTISVIIPTYHRPQLLKETIESIWAQTVKPDEILIGDDSKNDETEKLVAEELIPGSLIPIRYFRNSPALGQAKNVDMLISQASGNLISLMHDDDLYCPTAFQVLAPCFKDAKVAVAFGKQFLADEFGRIDQKASEQLNKTFYRTKEAAQVPMEFLDSAILQQFPNNGYLIRAEIAKTVGYAKAGQLFGDACDQGFSILCAMAFPELKVSFLDQHTAIYRQSLQSVGRSNHCNDAGYRAFMFVSQLSASITAKPHVRKWLEEKAPIAIAQAVNLGFRWTAVQIYFSRWHRRRILTLGGMKRGLLLLLPI